MRILHVTECYDGGVSRAIDSIAKFVPEHEHLLLWEGHTRPSVGLYHKSARLPKNPISRIFSVNRLARAADVDLIHAHSSWAGFYSRTLRPAAPLIYQPHCFVFDDPERSNLSKAIYRAAESLLSRHSKAIFVLTPHEKRLAQALNARPAIHLVPNVATIEVTKSQWAKSDQTEIVMAGRLAAQKDPEYFGTLARLVRQKRPEVKFTWLGDGDPSYRDYLKSCEVNVSGWLDTDSLASKLDSASIYFHSARYEGFPLSVLDAAAADLPILVRDLECFEGFDLESVQSPQEAAAAVVALIDDRRKFMMVRSKSRRLLETMNPEAQRQAIESGYAQAVST
ncbi:glycosyltransferase [Arthrobacter sp. USHLN218]|uniref:glycosyltransferase n=1 Tax=Arthrobacter sp. USHLN218 TaxID=3081232 RepID=UPI00301AC356